MTVRSCPRKRGSPHSRPRKGGYPHSRPRKRGSPEALALALGLAAASLPLVACGAAAPAPAVAPPENPAAVIDADPLALFLGSPAALATLDAHAFYASQSAGAQLAAFAEAALPLGQEAGFVPSRDVDRAFVAAYASARLDVTVILSGRFDVAKIQALAASHAPTRTGAPCVALPYAGRTLYTVSNLAFSPLTDHTMVAGNEGAVRRVLDRLAMGGAAPHPRRELPDWMLAAVQAPGSSFALAADLASIPPAAMHGWQLPPAVAAVSRLAVVGDFHPPGLNVAATLTYTDAARAASGAEALKQLATYANVVANLGLTPRIQNLTITPDGANVACKFALDDESMRRALGTLGKLLPAANAPAPLR